MKTLCMDTANKYLVVALYEDGKLVCGEAKESWKKQSEMLIPVLIQCMEKAGWKSDDLDEVVITDGPGSYTGVRIAMTAAKVLCTQKQIPLYTISSLQLYAGISEQAMVLMDARSHRAYVALLDKGHFISAEQVLDLDKIKAMADEKEYTIFGDAALLGEKAAASDLLKNFADLRPFYKKVENVHILTPRYLKDQSAYRPGAK